MTNSWSALSLGQLKQAVELRERIAALEIELAGVFGGDDVPTTIMDTYDNGQRVKNEMQLRLLLQFVCLSLISGIELDRKILRDILDPIEGYMHGILNSKGHHSHGALKAGCIERHRSRAAEALGGQATLLKKTRREHAIPLNFLIEKLRVDSQILQTPEALREFLNTHLISVLIEKKEQALLDSSRFGLKDNMPADWRWGCDPLARFNQASIVIICPDAVAVQTNSLSGLSDDQLKQAIQLREQIVSLENELAAIFGVGISTSAAPTVASVVPTRRGRPPSKPASVVPATLSTAPVPVHKGRGGARVITHAARAKMAASAKARWAKHHESRGTIPKSALPKKSGMSPIGRARIIAALKARWAKYRKEKGLKG